MAGRNEDPGATREVDVVVVGAGFAGLYAIYKFRDVLGCDVQCFETAEGVGGTWYWNRYPGARCDSESYYYCYSFSKELAQEWEWTGRYPEQPEIERYLNHVADRFDLRRSIELGTKVTAARFDDASQRWVVETQHGERVSCQWLITAVGCLSTPHEPNYPGIEAFGGEVYYTQKFPREGVDFAGKRVGLIGTGSSGIQSTPVIAAQAKHLTVFQRTPNFTIPARHKAFDPEDQKEIKSNYDSIFARTKESPAGFPYFPIERETLSVSEDERAEIFEDLWDQGGFRFLWGGFSDLTRNPEANAITSEFIRDKIRGIVNDPETAELLCPFDHPYGSKRPPIDTDYYVTYNRDNVQLVDIRSAPIEAFTETGLRTAAGEYDLDVIVFATGFDAMTGSLLRMNITGAEGRRLEQVWEDGPRTHLGLQVAGFPNMFTITGPGSPSVLLNMPVAIEQHVDWIADCITYAKERGSTRIESTEQAQDEWVKYVAEVAGESLMGQANSWYVGANIPGKPRVITPFAGGNPLYRERCAEVVEAGYKGFEFSG